MASITVKSLMKQGCYTIPETHLKKCEYCGSMSKLLKCENCGAPINPNQKSSRNYRDLTEEEKEAFWEGSI